MSAVPFPKIALTGDIGSGKSAVSKVLVRELGVNRYSTGDLQREIAARRGMTTLELNKYAETHPEIDEEIDGASTALGRRDESFVIDSRIAWHFIPQSFKVYLTVPVEVAARRILGDSERQRESYADLQTAIEKIRARRQSEVDRFRTVYGIDLSDMANYDLVVDTAESSIEEVAEKVLQAFQPWAAGG